jgi:4-hydroxy-tetrahydrodipicolinate synthase
MAKSLLDLHGIVTVLNTPFTESNQVDLAALQLNVRNAIAAGVAGFLVPAMASEVDKLSDIERFTMVQAVIDECHQHTTAVKIIGGASAVTPELRVSNVRKMVELGCDGVLVALPFENENQYLQEIAQIARFDPSFLMLQDWAPSGYGVPLLTILKAFQEFDCFRAIKVEVVPAGIKYSEILNATNGTLNVSGGWAVSQLIEGLDRGVHAFMPTGMHSLYCAIYQKYSNGDREGAQRLFHQILPILAFSNQHLDISIQFFKRLLWRQGIYPTPNVRPPILPFDRIHQQHADALIELEMQLEKSINHT